jgi:hypothetical protein
MDEGFKKCYKCGLRKPRTEFYANKGRSDGLGTACKPCANKMTLRRQIANREFINTLKSRPCFDCNKQYPPFVMQFDHVRGEKRFNIGESRGRSRASLLGEVAKCQVVCANCHATRTHMRRILAGQEEE